VYWSGSDAVAFNCATGTRSALPIDVVAFLSEIPDWTSPAALARARPELGAVSEIAALLEGLIRLGLVEKRADGRERDAWCWDPWMPEAAFFHFATRNHTYRRSTLDFEAELRAKAQTDPPPPPTKSVAGVRFHLPSGRVEASLQHALHTRRTWRRFSSTPVALADLATLLHSTFGVQKWGTVQGQGRIALKTAPSGGARHSIEAYLVARNVGGLEKGVYHYDAAANDIVRVAPSVPQRTLEHALGNQQFFMPAAAFVVMTAVFARAMWRYPFSRAYRTVLAEAGHHGQTFCLLATALDLAPFCTMAFRDSELESIIRVDGISESALYVVGVGTRPERPVAHPGRIPLRAPRPGR
jgi:SagB-type dehydrogenase family enzyme